MPIPHIFLMSRGRARWNWSERRMIWWPHSQCCQQNTTQIQLYFTFNLLKYVLNRWINRWTSKYYDWVKNAIVITHFLLRGRRYYSSIITIKYDILEKGRYLWIWTNRHHCRTRISISFRFAFFAPSATWATQSGKVGGYYYIYMHIYIYTYVWINPAPFCHPNDTTKCENPVRRQMSNRFGEKGLQLNMNWLLD